MNTQMCVFLGIPCKIDNNNLVVYADKGDLMHSVGTFVVNYNDTHQIVGDNLAKFIVNSLVGDKVINNFKQGAKTSFVLYRVDGDESKKLASIYISKLIPSGTKVKVGVLRTGSFNLQLQEHTDIIQKQLKTMSQLIEQK